MKNIYHEHFTKVDVMVHNSYLQRGALKTYAKKQMTERELERRKKYILEEVRVNKLLDGVPNIVPLWFYYETEYEWGLMTKYMNHGILNTYIPHYKTERCIVYEVVYPLLTALVYIHQNKIIHRDLKPENIMVHQRRIYLGDFGYSYVLEQDDDYASGLVGTLQYMAPELLHVFLTRETTSLKYRYEVDIWALGIITYELLFHRKPFGWSGYRNIAKQNPTNPTFIQNCLETPLNFPRFISESAKDFLQRCLDPNPTKRSSARELLEHPWVTNYLNSRGLSLEKCPLECESNPPSLNPKEASALKAQGVQRTSFSKNRCIMF